MTSAKDSNHWSGRALLIPMAAVALVFIISRVLYDRAGIEFQGDTYLGYWQFIDPKLLRTDLWRSIFFLHGQPPLLNLFTGIVLQVFPANHEEVFRILYFIFGLVLAISIYLLGIFLHLPPWLSALISAWFIISPASVLYEHWLAYAYPLTTSLTLAGVCLYQFLRTQKTCWGLIFFAFLGIMALTWSLFHIAWLFGFAALLFLLKIDRKKLFIAASLPLLLVTAWYGKNLVIFGEFTASSWAGMNLAKIATFRVSEKERRQMVKSGELSKFALLPPFRNPLVYLKLLPETPLTGIPVLDEPETSLHGRNHHHLIYVEASKYYLRDSIRIIRVKPNSYLRSIGQAVYIYFHSASDFDLTNGNRNRIATFDLWWNRVLYGQWQSDETSIERNSNISAKYVGWWIVMGFLIVTLGSAAFLWKNRGNLAEPKNVFILFMAYNIAYVTLIGNVMDIGENNRFRYTIDPFLSILFVFFLQNLISWTRPGNSEKKY